MLFIAKGAPYIEENEMKAWLGEKIIRLTSNQNTLWKFFYGTVRSYGDLIKYMGELAETDTPMKKDLMQHTIMQLKSLGLLAYSEKDTKLDEFIMIFSNQIVPVKINGISEEFDLKLYERIEKYDNMSIADIIADMDNLNYSELTNGYDRKYLEYIYEAPHAYSVKTSILRMIQNGNLCLI